MTGQSARELLDFIEKKELEIQQAEQEKAQAFEELSKVHGKQFSIGGETKLVVRRVVKDGPVRYHFRNLGRGAVKVEEDQK